MTEIRIHGRGGQGGVTLAQLLAMGFVSEGKDARSFPLFGAERRGAPVIAFARISDSKIFRRDQVYEPDFVVVLDPSLMEIGNITKGFKSNTVLLINTREKPSGFKDSCIPRIVCVDAIKIALKHGLGTKTNPFVNTVMLGAIAKVIGSPSLKDIVIAIEEMGMSRLRENIEATKEAYKEVEI